MRPVHESQCRLVGCRFLQAAVRKITAGGKRGTSKNDRIGRLSASRSDRRAYTKHGTKNAFIRRPFRRATRGDKMPASNVTKFVRHHAKQLARVFRAVNQAGI